MKVLYTPRFAKEYRKLPNNIQEKAEKKEKIFRQDPFNSSLKTHKLKGDLYDFYSFSITYHYRIVFHFKNNKTIVFDNIGTHEIYK